jgi:N-acylglucosamine-6-phosphate 2-epimerase
MRLLEALRGGLIVSVQAWRGSALDDQQVIAAMARAAQDGGAVAVRIEGIENLLAGASSASPCRS